MAYIFGPFYIGFGCYASLPSVGLKGCESRSQGGTPCGYWAIGLHFR